MPSPVRKVARYIRTLGGATLKAGMTERRNGGITERRKITPNPKRQNRGTAENTPKS